MSRTLAAAVLLLSAAALVAQNSVSVTQTEAGKKALERIRQSGALAQEIAQNDNRLEISFARAAEKPTDEQLALLKDLAGLIHLDLGALPITDAQLVYLKPLTALTRLHLEKIGVNAVRQQKAIIEQLREMRDADPPLEPKIHEATVKLLKDLGVN